MRTLFKDIKNTKIIFILLLIGFIFSILPASIAISTRNSFLQKAYENKNGKFEHYYTLQVNNPSNIDINFLQKISEKNFVKSSAIIENINLNKEGFPPISLIVLLSDNNWKPPIIEGRYFNKSEKDALLVGKDIYSLNCSDTFRINDTSYNIVGISGFEDTIGYNNKIFMKLDNLPDEILQNIKSQSSLSISIRSNKDPKTEIANFISNLNQNVEIIEEKVEKNTFAYRNLQELLGAPIRLLLISMINLIIISFLWIHTKRRDISLRKALGGSNLNIFIYIWGQLLVCSLAAVLITLLFQSILNIADINIKNFNIQIDPENILIGLVFSLILSLITCAFPINNIIKLQPAEALKEKG